MSGAAAVPFADLALARRLERAEAASSARYVEARARLFPAGGACWIEIAGAYAMFDGVASPVDADLRPRHVSGADGRRSRAARGVLSRPRRAGVPRGQPACRSRARAAAERARLPAVRVHQRDVPADCGRPRAVSTPAPSRARCSARTSRSSTRASPRKDGVRRDTATSCWRSAASARTRRACTCSSPSSTASAIAVGAMHLRDGVAHLAGASTIPEGRRRGAQLALLEHRLQYAAAHGCDIAMMCASPGQRIAAQRRAPRLPHRLHAHQVEAVIVAEIYGVGTRSARYRATRSNLVTELTMVGFSPRLRIGQEHSSDRRALLSSAWRSLPCRSRCLASPAAAAKRRTEGRRRLREMVDASTPGCAVGVATGGKPALARATAWPTSSTT